MARSPSVPFPRTSPVNTLTAKLTVWSRVPKAAPGTGTGEAKLYRLPDRSRFARRRGLQGEAGVSYDDQAETNR